MGCGRTRISDVHLGTPTSACVYMRSSVRAEMRMRTSGYVEHNGSSSCVVLSFSDVHLCSHRGASALIAFLSFSRIQHVKIHTLSLAGDTLH